MSVLRWNFLFSCGAVSLILLVACGKDTVGDMAKRDRERDQARSYSFFKEFAIAEGVYKGSGPEGDYVMDVSAAWTQSNQTANSIATPTFVGSLTFYPQVRVVNQDALVINFPVSDGTYVDNAKNLTVSLATGDTLSRMSCDLSDKANVVCTWFTNRGPKVLKFSTLERAKYKAVQRQKGTYVGENADGPIYVRFRTVVLPKPGIAQAQVSAEFLMTKKGQDPKDGLRLKSLDGTFDPFSRQLTFNMPATTPTVVTCTVKSAKVLSCTWNSVDSYDFELRAK